MSVGGAVFCYDANGNRSQKIDGSTTSYTYDAENHRPQPHFSPKPGVKSPSICAQVVL